MPFTSSKAERGYSTVMFSYRHAFHAGNHADVLKHMALVSVLGHLTLKDAALTVIDTHAGAGLYRLDGDYATTSDEAAGGVLRLLENAKNGQKAPVVKQSSDKFAINLEVKAVADYLALVARFNQGRFVTAVYPGSPFLAHAMLRPQDKLKLFELHPTDGRGLTRNLEQIEGVGASVQLFREDGFEGLRKSLPPPAGSGGSKRALVLIDPSYEIKTDYMRVEEAVEQALKKFATGCYFVWYPIIPRPEAHGLPRRLKTLANQAGKSWLNATLNIGKPDDAWSGDKHGLTASGVFVVNPPHTLKAFMTDAMPQLKAALGQGKSASFAVESLGI